MGGWLSLLLVGTAQLLLTPSTSTCSLVVSFAGFARLVFTFPSALGPAVGSTAWTGPSTDISRVGCSGIRAPRKQNSFYIRGRKLSV